MGKDRYPKNVLEQVLRWGAQTIGFAMVVKEYDDNELIVVPSCDDAKIRSDKIEAESQALWDATANELGEAASADAVIVHYSARILALAADHISETTLRVDASTLASLKSIVDEAVQKSSTPLDTKPEKILGLLGQNLIRYLAGHDDQYPDTLGQMEEIRKDQRFAIDYAWVSQHIKYLGAGKACKTNRPNMIIAYDLSMLAERNGTFVLFNDAHVEHISNQRAIKMGLKPF